MVKDDTINNNYRGGDFLNDFLEKGFFSGAKVGKLISGGHADGAFGLRFVGIDSGGKNGH